MAVASTIKREGRKEKERPDKPIRLNDLIPTRDVAGGRKAVFGSAPNTPNTTKRKGQK